MKNYRKIVMLLVCIFVCNCISVPAAATEIDTIMLSSMRSETIGFDNDTTITDIEAWSTGSYDWTIASGRIVKGDTAFLLGQDEVVTINCTYSPRAADLDIGLIAPDGIFYYISTSGGVFNESIRVSDAGYYYLTIRNNSDNSVSVKGFVYY